MLVLTRKNRESVVVGGDGALERVLTVTVLEITRGRVKLGFEADADVPVQRLEVWTRMCAENESQLSGLGAAVSPGSNE